MSENENLADITIEEQRMPRWVSLYEKYSEAVLNPSNCYISPEDSEGINLA
jgi:hypothetical protein